MPAAKKTTSSSKTSAEKSAVAKKTAKKAPAKKTTTAKKAAKKAPAKKTTTAKKATKKVPAKKTTAVKKTAKKAPAKKTTAAKKTVKKAPAKKTTAKEAKANIDKAVKSNKKKSKENEKTIRAKASSKKTTMKQKTSWKDNSLLFYAYNFIVVSIITVAVRMLSALGLSNFMGLDWSVNYKLKYVPVLAFSERNVVLFEKMNTLSLVITTLVISLLFIYNLYRKVNTKQDYSRYVVRSNAWFIGIFVSIVTFVASLFMSESIHYATNILGLIPIVAILLISVILYFVKMDKVDKEFL